MSVSDRVKRAIKHGYDGTSSPPPPSQDVEMQNTAPASANEVNDNNVRDIEAEKSKEENAPKNEKVATAELFAIPSSSKDQVVNVNFADLTAFITNIASKITNGNPPPSASNKETVKFKEPEVEAKKQEVQIF